MRIVVILEVAQLAVHVNGVPEEYPIKVLTPDCSDQPFDVRMREAPPLAERLNGRQRGGANVGSEAADAGYFRCFQRYGTCAWVIAASSKPATTSRRFIRSPRRTGEDRSRHLDTECLRDLEVHDEIEFFGLFDREVFGPGATQNLGDQSRDMPEGELQAGSAVSGVS
jgi:hypothetical protein